MEIAAALFSFVFWSLIVLVFLIRLRKISEGIEQTNRWLANIAELLKQGR